MKDFYDVLGVTKTATLEEIKKAYRKAASTHHPDVNSDPEATNRFREIQEAYETLSDPEKKRIYDSGGYGMNFRRHQSDPGEQPGFSFNDLFGNTIFRGRNLSIQLQVELKEIVTGATKKVLLRKKKKCNTCNGLGFSGFESCVNCKGSGVTVILDGPLQITGPCNFCSGSGKIYTAKCMDCTGSGASPGFTEKTLNIVVPCGVENGAQVRIPGEGEESARGGNFGDLFVFVLIKDHYLYQRQGLDLTVDIPVSYTQLVLGCELEIPYITEGTINIKVPPGSQSHSKLRLKEKGIPSSTTIGLVGDLIVTLKCETPKKIEGEYLDLINKLAEFEKTNITPRRDRWFKKLKEDSK